MKREALRVTSTIPVAPTTLYFAWIDSEHHSSMTGATAKIDPNVGAKYSALDGYVTGKLVILDLGRRIVMSWRTTDFPRDAVDSRVEVHFETLGASTRILILHTDIPEGQSDKYKALWNDRYITPMRTYFSKFLPDPRNPPVRRPPPPPLEVRTFIFSAICSSIALSFESRRVEDRAVPARRTPRGSIQLALRRRRRRT